MAGPSVEHLKGFIALTEVQSAGGKPWSVLRVLRAKAMVILGFMAYLRKSEVDSLDRAICLIVCR